MKYVAILLLVVLLALPVCADSFLKDKVSLSISTLQLNNTDADDYMGSPMGFTFAYKLSEEKNVETGISIGYFTADRESDVMIDGISTSDFGARSVDYTMTTVPVMLTQRWNFKQGTKFQPYLGYGFGFNWTQQEISLPRSTTGLSTRAGTIFAREQFSLTQMTGAYQFTAGAKFGNGFFLDAKYVSGGDSVNSGCIFSLGKSF